MRDRDHGGLPGDGRGGSAERGDALEPIGRRARHTIALLDRPCESCRRDHAPRPAPCRELVELVRAALRALPRRDDVVREHELGYQNERETRRTHPSLDLELDLRREAAGLDDRAQPARRLRVATEDVTRLELEHARLAPRHACDVERERAAIVHVEPQPAGRASPVHVAIRRVEVQIAVERPLGGAGAQAERRRCRKQLIQAFGARHIPANHLGHDRMNSWRVRPGSLMVL